MKIKLEQMVEWLVGAGDPAANEAIESSMSDLSGPVVSFMCRLRTPSFGRYELIGKSHVDSVIKSVEDFGKPRKKGRKLSLEDVLEMRKNAPKSSFVDYKWASLAAKPEDVDVKLTPTKRAIADLRDPFKAQGQSHDYRAIFYAFAKTLSGNEHQYALLLFVDEQFAVDEIGRITGRDEETIRKERNAVAEKFLIFLRDALFQ